MAKLSVSRYKSTADACDTYLSMVDSAAEDAQRISAGRAAMYSDKLTEARNPDNTTPLLDDEAKARGITRQEQIESVLSADESWRQRMRKIEVARAGAKAKIRAASNAREMHQIARAFADSL